VKLLGTTSADAHRPFATYGDAGAGVVRPPALDEVSSSGYVLVAPRSDWRSDEFRRGNWRSMERRQHDATLSRPSRTCFLWH